MKTVEKIGLLETFHWEIYRSAWYYQRVEYPFPPVGIVGAADGKNRRVFLCPPAILETT